MDFVSVGRLNFTPERPLATVRLESAEKDAEGLTVETDSLARQTETQETILPIRQDHPQLVPLEPQLAPLDIAPVGTEAALLELPLYLEEPHLVAAEPSGRARGQVDEEEDGDDAYDDGPQALENEDPSPTLIAADPVHLRDGGGEQAGEGTRDGPCAVEGADADRKLAREVVRRGEVGRGREEAGPVIFGFSG